MPHPSLRRASAAWFALASVAAMGATPSLPRTAPPMTAIAYTRIQYDDNGFARSSGLAISDGATANRALTANVDGVHDAGASWSPRGTQLVFGRHVDGAHGGDTLYVANRRGDVHRIAQGRGLVRLPAWGPQGDIAFVSSRGAQPCVSLVDSEGHGRRELFCPTQPTTELSRPTWSGDGSALYVSGGYYTGRLEPVWHAQAWRVDPATGAGVLLSERVMEEPRLLSFSPDGSRGIYSDPNPTEMTLVDFRTGEATSLGVGCFPRWSPDGARIAFSGEVYEGAPDFRYYQPLFVMDADGAHARRVTVARVENHIYAPADWSRDGRRVLANRIVFTDPSVTRRTVAMRIIDVDSGRVAQLPAGFAEPGAWFER